VNYEKENNPMKDIQNTKANPIFLFQVWAKLVGHIANTKVLSKSEGVVHKICVNIIYLSSRDKVRS
jgi:hypothetical protein